MATINALVEKVERRLSMAAGLDVQLHAEDRIVDMLQHKYDVVFDEFWWLDYLTLETFTLDGSTGVITGDVTTKIKRFVDIRSIHFNNEPDPLPLIPFLQNPAQMRRRVVAPYNLATKRFRIYPLDSVGSVHVWYRTKIDWDDLDQAVDDIPMDEHILVLGTCLDFLIDDGSNGAAEEKFERMFTARVEQLRKLELSMGVLKASNELANTPDDWYMVP